MPHRRFSLQQTSGNRRTPFLCTSSLLLFSPPYCFRRRKRLLPFSFFISLQREAERLLPVSILKIRAARVYGTERRAQKKKKRWKRRERRDCRRERWHRNLARSKWGRSLSFCLFQPLSSSSTPAFFPSLQPSLSSVPTSPSLSASFSFSLYFSLSSFSPLRSFCFCVIFRIAASSFLRLSFLLRCTTCAYSCRRLYLRESLRQCVCASFSGARFHRNLLPLFIFPRSPRPPISFVRARLRRRELVTSSYGYFFSAFSPYGDWGVSLEIFSFNRYYLPSSPPPFSFIYRSYI